MKWSAIKASVCRMKSKRIHCKNVLYVTKCTTGKEQAK